MKRLIDQSEICGENLVVAEVSNSKVLRKIVYDPNSFISYHSCSK